MSAGASADEEALLVNFFWCIFATSSVLFSTFNLSISVVRFDSSYVL